MAEGAPLTVITTFDALMAPQVSLEDWRRHVVSIDRQSSVEEHELASTLSGALAMRDASQVEEAGAVQASGAAL